MSSPSTPRNLRLAADLREVFEDASGIEIGDNEVDVTFIELGFDSLLLTQVASTAAAPAISVFIGTMVS